MEFYIKNVTALEGREVSLGYLSHLNVLQVSSAHHTTEREALALSHLEKHGSCKDHWWTEIIFRLFHSGDPNELLLAIPVAEVVSNDTELSVLDSLQLVSFVSAVEQNDLIFT